MFSINSLLTQVKYSQYIDGDFMSEFLKFLPSLIGGAPAKKADEKTGAKGQGSTNPPKTDDKKDEFVIYGHLAVGPKKAEEVPKPVESNLPENDVEKQAAIFLAKHDAKTFFENYRDYLGKPYTVEVFVLAAKTKPDDGIDFFRSNPFALPEESRKEFFEAAIESAAKNDPTELLDFFIFARMERELGEEEANKYFAVAIMNMYNESPARLLSFVTKNMENEKGKFVLATIEKQEKGNPFVKLAYQVSRESPGYLNSHLPSFASKPFAPDVAVNASRYSATFARNFLKEYGDEYKDKPGFKNTLPKIAESLVKLDPRAALNLIDQTDDVDEDARTALKDALNEAIKIDANVQLEAMRFIGKTVRLKQKNYLGSTRTAAPSAIIGRRALGIGMGEFPPPNLISVDRRIGQYFMSKVKSNPENVLLNYRHYDHDASHKAIFLAAAKNSPIFLLQNVELFVKGDDSVLSAILPHHVVSDTVPREILAEALVEAAKLAPEEAFSSATDLVRNLEEDEAMKILRAAYDAKPTSVFNLRFSQASKPEGHPLMENIEEMIFGVVDDFPSVALRKFNSYKSYLSPSVRLVVLKAATDKAIDQSPGVVLRNMSLYEDYPSKEEVLEKAAKSVAKLDPFAVIKFKHLIKGKKYEKEVLAEAVKNFKLVDKSLEFDDFMERYKFIQSEIAKINPEFTVNNETNELKSTLDKFNFYSGLSLECCGIYAGESFRVPNGDNNQLTTEHDYEFVFINTYRGKGNYKHVCIKITKSELEAADTEVKAKRLLEAKLKQFNRNPNNDYPFLGNTVTLPKGETSMLLANVPEHLGGTYTDMAELLSIFQNQFEVNDALAVMQSPRKFNEAASGVSDVSIPPTVYASKKVFLKSIKSEIVDLINRAKRSGMKSPTFILPNLAHGDMSGTLKLADGEVTNREIADVLKQEYNGKPLCEQVQIAFQSERCHGDVNDIATLLVREGVPIKGLIIVSSSAEDTYATAFKDEKSSLLINDFMRGDKSGAFNTYFSFYVRNVLNGLLKDEPKGKSVGTYGHALQFAAMMTSLDSEINQVPVAYHLTHDPDLPEGKQTIMRMITPRAEIKKWFNLRN